MDHCIFIRSLLPLGKEFFALPNMRGNHIPEENSLNIVLSNVVCAYPQGKPRGYARIAFGNEIFEPWVSGKILETVDSLVQMTPSSRYTR